MEIGVCLVAGSAHIKTLPFLATQFVYFATEFQTAFFRIWVIFPELQTLTPWTGDIDFFGIGLEYTKPFLELSGRFTAMVGFRSCRHRWSDVTATQHFSSSTSYGISCLWSCLYIPYILKYADNFLHSPCIYPSVTKEKSFFMIKFQSIVTILLNNWYWDHLLLFIRSGSPTRLTFAQFTHQIYIQKYSVHCM